MTSLLARAGFKSAKLETHQGVARYPSLAAFARTEIDGWVLKGRVDVDALLEAARDRLQPSVTETGAVHIPLEGHIVTASKD